MQTTGSATGYAVSLDLVQADHETPSRYVQVGNDRMTLALEWSGQDEFAQQPLREWTVDGKSAGVTRSAGPLTFVTVDGAGHMVR